MDVFRRIAGEIAAQIASGALAPGARIPSTRQIMAQHGVAMATATKVITHLREQGLVQTSPGRGTTVTRPRAGTPDTPDRDLVVRTAITIANAEGLPAVSMRRLAGELGMPTMSLYGHVADKEELVLLMMDRVMAAHPPPSLDPAVHGWRVCVEALARLQWRMYRQQPWLAQAVSFTRPLLAPHAMAHTEWTMQALDGHGLDPSTLFAAAVMLANHVRGTAVNLEAEAQAEQETGMTESEWMESQEARFAAVLATGKLPMLSGFLATDPSFDLDLLMEFGLQRLLDGLSALLDAA
ncbi:TetR/AcrR family transcriptional regulator C-terminal domain-containing protein [Dactylosporangium sucinum]|uniref:GntR family transcriptional regulator n=1 Tax=Dactylosporangium sucinum TaxID=1424081 RepID=A0A917WK88_9ACTN|nr:TetR/AcrR family transcriptional regulator C-terminal domain-containing protein [Dactylosporangium sucinum]GGM12051.1 GntR family transcriptional regulator [Dactylosporangium sucinum]